VSKNWRQETDAGLFTSKSKSKSKSIRRVTSDRFRITTESALRLLTTLPLLTRDKDTAAALPRRELELLLLIGTARQCPMLREYRGLIADVLGLYLFEHRQRDIELCVVFTIGVAGAALVLHEHRGSFRDAIYTPDVTLAIGLK